MKEQTSRLSVLVIIAPLVIAVALPAVYVGGYFLLPDSKGLYPAKWQFDAYEPAFKLQRQLTRKPVMTGYVDSKGRRFAKGLP